MHQRNITKMLNAANFYSTVKALLIAAVLWTAYKITRSVRTRRFNQRQATEWGCQSPKKYPLWDPFFGLDLFIDTIRHIKAHTIFESMQRRFEQLGTNTMRVRFLNGDFIVTREPENLKALLSLNFDSFGLKALRYPLVPLLGDGIFTIDGAAWQQSRNLLRPMFTRTQIADLSIFEKHVDRFLDKIPYDRSTIDLQPLFFTLTLDISSHVFLGESTDCQIANGSKTPATEFADAFNRIMKSFSDGSQIELFGIKLPNKKFKKDCKLVHDFVDSSILKALEMKSEGLLDEKEGFQSRTVFLHELVAQTDNVVQIRAEILSTILAGRDTTASMTSDLWFELSKHPSVFAALRQEVDAISSQHITLELLKSMKYLRAVLNETLRIHPVVPENARLALVDTTLPLGGGDDGMSPVFIPEKTAVAWSVYAMHRRKDIYGEDAEEFRPERWIDTEEVKGIRPGWAYLPFNGGPRVCLGQQFALAQVSYLTVRLIQMIATLESRDPGPWVEMAAIAVTGLNGCKVALTAR